MKPHVALCLATSLDGRIAAEPGAPPDFTSRYDRHKLFRLRAEADVLLIGANTVRQEQLPPLIRNPELVAARRAAGKSDHPAAAIVSGSLNLPWDSPYFTNPKQDLLVLTAHAPEDLRHKADRLGVALLETGNPFSLERGLELLAEKGYRNVLGEGGGRLNHALLDADLVDRLVLTVAPVIIAGRDTPLLCNGPVLEPPARFVLAEHQAIESELHLIYDRQPTGKD